MADRYLVECDTKPCCEFGTNNYKFKNANVVKLGSAQKVVSLYEEQYAESIAKHDGFEAGSKEAWELAQKILELPSKGGYTPEELVEIFGTDAAPYIHDLIRRYTFHEVVAKIQKLEERKAKTFHVGDVVKLHWGGEDNRLAVVTWTKPGSELLGIVLDDGNVGDIVKNQCSKTGKTLNVASLLVELNGEEE